MRVFRPETVSHAVSAEPAAASITSPFPRPTCERIDPRPSKLARSVAGLVAVILSTGCEAEPIGSDSLEGPEFMDELSWTSFSTKSASVVVATTEAEPVTICIYDIDGLLARDIEVAPRAVTEIPSDEFPVWFQAFSLDVCPGDASTLSGGVVVDRERSDSDQHVLVSIDEELDSFFLTSADYRPAGTLMNLSSVDFSLCVDEFVGMEFSSGTFGGFGGDFSAVAESWIVPGLDGTRCATQTRWLDGGATLTFLSDLDNLSHGEIRLLVFFDSSTL